jgi:anaerobic magnesium-protoporphyrin IX monomethyl ester cyclase
MEGRRVSSQSVDLLLVNPGNRLKQFASLHSFATVAPPLGIAMIAAYAREHGISVAIIDAEAEFWTPAETIAAIQKYDPLIVGLTTFTTKMSAAEETMHLVKAWRSDVFTLVGGHHASAIPRETVAHPDIDFVAAGEGYHSVVDLVSAVKAGNATPDIQGIWNKKSSNAGMVIYPYSMDTLPYPAWDLLPMDKYRAHHWQGWGHKNPDLSRFGLLRSSAGCPFSCRYCSVNVVYGKNYVRYINPQRVADELQLLVEKYGVKFIEIIDDTFTLNWERTHSICDAIIERGLGDEVEMWCFSRTDRTDPALLKKMRAAGITFVFIGLESGSDEVLMGINKKQTVAQIKEACKKVWDAGIYIGGNYMFGLRNDTHETMQKTLDLALELKTEWANMFVMQAYPGTEYHEMAKEKGYPLPKTWDQYGFFAPDAVPLRNDNLDCKDILSFRDNAFVEYYSNPEYHRVLERKFGADVVEYVKGMLNTKIERSH